MNKFNNFLSLQKKIFKAILIELLLLLVFRLVFMFRFGEVSVIKSHAGDLLKLFINSFRFDMLVLAYLLLPVELLTLLSLIFGGNGYSRFFRKFSLVYITIAFSFICLVVVIEHQFYAYFKYHFNAVLFDFFKEKPLLLLRSMWEENPVILIVVSLLFLFCLIYYSVKKVLYAKKSLNTHFSVFSQIGITVLIIGGYFLFMRGSVTTFPLHFEDINISDNEFINRCVPNSVYMLKEAYYETKNNFKIGPVENIAKDNGFQSIEDALSVFYQIPLDTIKKHPFEYWILKKSNLPDSTPKPNVVLVLVESWSNHLINFDSPRMDLLGSMRKHLKEDVVFRHFQSSGNGTITSLENLVTNCPYHPYFDSKYRFHSFPSSVAYPFKEAGYQTKFITGLEVSWRHLSEVLPIQYFDEVMGKYNVLKADPNAKSNTTWGVYDHHVLDFVFNQLKESKKPQFIMCLTSTSHTPFELPSNYPMPVLHPNADDQKHFDLTPDVAINYLRGYQYSNKALGDFMDKVKNSALAKNTIVVFTGDHNIRSIMAYKDKSVESYMHSVPLYIYFPEKIRKGLQIDTSKYGCHYDIIPSLVPHILPNTSYFTLGQDLFDAKADKDKYISVNDAMLLHGKGITDAEAESRNRARNVILAYYFGTAFKQIDQAK